MVKFGNWIFHYRNFLFPVFYLLLFIPSPEIFSSYRVAIIAGLIISFTGEFIRALVMGLVNIQHGGKERTIYSSGLITDGIFSHCRNPLYIGNILILLGLGVVANSLIFILVMIPLFIFFYQAMVIAEENYLEKNFGAPYLAYKTKVNRWLPNFSGLGQTFNSMRFSIQRVLIKEYNSTYLWMTGMVLLVMKYYWQHHDETSFQKTITVFIGILVLLLICYLLIRYMKKSKHWTAD
jgi:protein-S-isoprenylcysteine O-methyltransferase Ste14